MRLAAAVGRQSLPTVVVVVVGAGGGGGGESRCMLLFVVDGQLVHVVVIDAAAEDEAGQSVKVSEYGDGHDELGDGPAALAAALEQPLDVRVIDEPGLVAEEPVELVESGELGGHVLEAEQPRVLPILQRELVLLLLD